MEKINIDLNSLFNLSYNFENLKLLLTTISKNQDTFENKMKDIENKIKENSKSIEQILSGEIEVNKQGNLDNINNFIIEQSAKPSSAKKENQEKNLEEFTLKKSKDKNDFIDRKESDSDKNLQEFYNYKMSKENKMLLNELDNKIILLEDKIKKIYNFIPSLPQDEAKTLKDILDEFKMSLNNNHLDIKEIKENLSKIKNEIDEMNMKANDFNIYDIFKDVVDSGGDLEASKILIQALDKKTQERFKFEEEKIVQNLLI